MPLVYTVDLAGVENAPLEWLAALDDGEMARAARFQRACDRLAFVAAHALKRLALAQALPGRSAKALRFVTGRFGKPILAEGGAPHFNVSHTSGLVALAISFRAPIGIDVEARDAAVRYRNAIQSVLNEAERSTLEGAADLRDGLLALWTAKEAVAKAEGMGLSLPLSEIAVDQHRAQGPSRWWKLWRSRPTPYHLLTFAWDGNGDAVEVHRLCAENLTAWAFDEGQALARFA